MEEAHAGVLAEGERVAAEAVAAHAAAVAAMEEAHAAAVHPQTYTPNPSSVRLK